MNEEFTLNYYEERRNEREEEIAYLNKYSSLVDGSNRDGFSDEEIRFFCDRGVNPFRIKDMKQQVKSLSEEIYNPELEEMIKINDNDIYDITVANREDWRDYELYFYSSTNFMNSKVIFLDNFLALKQVLSQVRPYFGFSLTDLGGNEKDSIERIYSKFKDNSLKISYKRLKLVGGRQTISKAFLADSAESIYLPELLAIGGPLWAESATSIYVPKLEHIDYILASEDNYEAVKGTLEPRLHNKLCSDIDNVDFLKLFCNV